MKLFLQCLIAVGVLLWLSVVSMGVASDVFIKDIVELHGSRLMGSAVKIEDVSAGWKDRKFSLHDVCFSGEIENNILCAGSVLFQLPPDFLMDWRRSSIIPSILTVDFLEVKDIAIFYDIDSEGENFRKLRSHLSEASAEAMKDRLNARTQNAATPMLVQIKTLKISGIKVDARSQKYPERSKVFNMDSLELSDLGGQDNGITSVEALEKITHAIVDGVQRAAKQQGLVEIPLDSEGGRFSRKRTTVKEGGNSSDSDKENGAEKTVRSMGASLKKTGADIWQRTKKMFN